MDEPRLNALGQPVGRGLERWRPPAFPTPQRWVGRYCSLEPLDAGRHGSALFDAFSEDTLGANWTYMPDGPFFSKDAFQSWLSDRARSRDPQFYAVLPAMESAPEGIVGFLRINPDFGTLEIGQIQFAERLKRTRAATEALSRMISLAFTMGYRRVEWKCDALNQPSRSAAQRLGFAYEGVFRQALVVKGRNRDTVWYSIIDTDWVALKPAHERWLSERNFDSEGRQRGSLREWTRPLLEAIDGVEPSSATRRPV